jgi:hypothetical protein
MVQPGVVSVMVVGGVHPDLSAEETPSGINTTSLPMRPPLSGSRSFRIAM